MCRCNNGVRDATFLENEFSMQGNSPSTSSQEPVISPDSFVPIDQVEQTSVENE